MTRKEFITRWKKERSFYEQAKVIDLRTHKESSWPYDPPTEEHRYNRWLAEVVDQAKDEYYKGKKKISNVSEDGIETFTEIEAEPEQIVEQITRIKSPDGKEFLVSKGKIVGYNEFGDRRELPYSWIEMYNEQTFAYDRGLDPRTHKLTNICQGPKETIPHYLMPFTDKNVDKLWDMRDKNRCLLTVTDKTKGGGKQCLSLEMFKTKPFEYILNDDFLTEKEKEQRRQDFQALQTGLIAARTKAK